VNSFIREHVDVKRQLPVPEQNSIKDQYEDLQDALFTLSLFQLIVYKRFEQAYCTSSGGSVYTAIGICHAFMSIGC
jgi:hypothetical protein